RPPTARPAGRDPGRGQPAHLPRAVPRPGRGALPAADHRRRAGRRRPRVEGRRRARPTAPTARGGRAAPPRPPGRARTPYPVRLPLPPSREDLRVTLLLSRRSLLAGLAASPFVLAA